jgi:hypothetical protein
VHGLGDVFGELFTQRGIGRAIPPGGTRTFVKDVVIEESKQLPAGAPTEAEQPRQASIPETNGTPKAGTDAERILRIFSVNGAALELTDNRLRATSAADYYRRLTYLVLYANELRGRLVTPRADLTAILREAKVYDTNCRTWLTKKKGFTVDPDDRLKLNVAAREQAARALDDALNTTLTDGWNPDTKTPKARGVRKKKA